MKKYLIIASAALVALAACNKEVDIKTPVSEEDILLTFTSERPQIEADTKTAWDDETSSVVWSTNDKIRVAYTLDGEWMGRDAAGAAKLYTSNAVSIDANSSNVGSFTVPVSNSAFVNPGTSGKYVFYSLYPSTAVSGADAPNAPVVNLQIPVSQTPSANSFDSSADILVGCTAEEVMTGIPTEAIELNWTRVVAHAFFTFKDFKGVGEGETVTEIVLTAQSDANLVGYEAVSLEDGSYTASTSSSNVTNVLRIQGENLAFVDETVESVTMKNIKAWACVLPETITSLSVDVETNKAHYTREITGISKAFKQNAKNNLAINMSGATRTAKAAAPRLFEDGDYLITITSEDGGDKMMAAAASSPQKAVATSTEVENGVYKAEKDAVWTIAYNSTDGTYSIKSVGKDQYLSGTASATDLKLASEPVFFTATEVSTGVYNFSVTGGGNTRYISYNYNNGSDRFALYVDGDYVKDITLLPAVAKEEQQIIETPKAGTDVLNYAFTGISGTSYAEWGPKIGSETNAYYIGQSGGANNSIQLRSTNNNSGIVVWKSSGYVKSVTVTWNSNTANGRTLDIYGKNTAYEATTELYDSAKQGTKVGSVVKGTSTTYTFTENYKYIGIRSNNSAMYLDEIEIEWGTEAFMETVATPSISFDSSTKQVSISCATEGATIYYTINGNDPTTNDKVYTGVIQLVSGDSFTVKAIAVKEGMINSAIASKAVAYSGETGNKTFTITDADFGTAYATNTFTKNDNITISYSNVANYGNGIQFRANTGELHNTTSLGTIVKITIKEQSGKSHTNLKVFAGTSVEDISTEITTTGLVYDFSNGAYSYFKFSNGSNAAYLSEIEVEYK